MSVRAKLVRFVRKPLPDKWLAIKSKFCSIVHDKRTTANELQDVNELRDEGGVPAAHYAPSVNSAPRLALVGCGWFACEAHIPVVQQQERDGLVELVALCSRS